MSFEIEHGGAIVIVEEYDEATEHTKVETEYPEHMHGKKLKRRKKDGEKFYEPQVESE